MWVVWLSGTLSGAVSRLDPDGMNVHCEGCSFVGASFRWEGVDRQAGGPPLFFLESPGCESLKRWPVSQRSKALRPGDFLRR